MLTCTKLHSSLLTKVAAAMLGTCDGLSGHSTHALHDKRALADTLRTAHRLHTRPKSGAEVLLRLAPAAAAQRNTCSMAAMASAGPCDRGDAPGASISAGNDAGRRGHSGSSSRGAPVLAAPKSSGLQSVRGIGPRNEQLLLAHEIASLGALQQHFSDKSSGDTVAMSRYLRVNPPLADHVVSTPFLQQSVRYIALSPGCASCAN